MKKPKKRSEVLTFVAYVFKGKTNDWGFGSGTLMWPLILDADDYNTLNAEVQEECRRKNGPDSSAVIINWRQI